MCMCVCSVPQLSLTFCNPMDCSWPGSSVRGISQAILLDWVAIFSPGDLPHPQMEPRWNPTLLCLLHCRRILYPWATGNMLVTQLCPALCDPMHCSRQAPLSMEFSRQEYWSVLPFTSPGDLPHPGFEPRSTALQADSLPSQLPPGKPLLIILAHERVNERYTQVSYKNH